MFAPAHWVAMVRSFGKKFLTREYKAEDFYKEPKIEKKWLKKIKTQFNQVSQKWRWCSAFKYPKLCMETEIVDKRMHNWSVDVKEPRIKPFLSLQVISPTCSKLSKVKCEQRTFSNSEILQSHILTIQSATNLPSLAQKSGNKPWFFFSYQEIRNMRKEFPKLEIDWVENSQNHYSTLDNFIP